MSEDEADVEVARADIAEPSARVREEPVAPASSSAGVAKAMAPAPEDESAEAPPAGRKEESSQASARGVGPEATEAKAPELEFNKEGVGVARSDVAELSEGDAEGMSTEAAIEDAWTMVECDMAAEAQTEVCPECCGVQGDVAAGNRFVF